MEEAQKVTAPASEAPEVKAESNQGLSALEVAQQKQREIWKQQQALKQKEQEIEKRSGSIPKEEDLLLKAKESFYEEFSRDPATALKNARIDMKKLLESASKGQPVERERPQVDPDELESRIREKIMGELTQKEQEQLKKKQEQEILSNFERERDQYLDSAPEQFEFVRNLPGGKALINQYIEAHFDETGEVLSFAEASTKAEQALENELKTVLQLEKVKRMLSSTNDTQLPNEHESSSQTLTNDFNQAEVSGTRRKLTEEESKAEAAKLIRWT